ncbi:hypothetical protein Q8F57_039620 [Paraburkholderia terrae]|uniref:hypothetical protein n=1 Tax=Paraburkholderia terrae TaxID=311230 RepID=UPI00296B3F59|nr:hypothetical protein [Paraburkholderia terrae]MDW3658694.1 hypothetical protein [Paraburkholderia terrae]
MNNMNIRLGMSIALVAILEIGCSATPALIRVNNAPPTGQPFDGVPMRLKKPQIVEVYRLDPDSDEYKPVATSVQNLADQATLYAVDVVAAPFTSPSLHITEYSDNTPKSLQVTSSNNSSGAIDAATAGLTGVTTARSTRTASCQTSNSAVVSADQALASARASYDNLSATASPELRAAYQQILANAQAAADYARKNPLCD